MKIFKEYLFPGLLLACLIFTLSMCKKDEAEDLIGNWTEQSDFEGDARSGAVTFTIGNLSYVGTGYDGTQRLKDFYYYNPENNSWTQVANFMGEARNAAVAFSVAGKGYVGTGNAIGKYFSDFWTYDPLSNSWSEAADLAECGGTARYGAVAFAINDTGYVAAGFDGNYLKDLWAYDASLDTFKKRQSIEGNKRTNSVAFVIDGKAYVCTGIENGQYLNDFFEYDPLINDWTEKRKIADVSDESYDDKYTIMRSGAVAFVMAGKGYVTTGSYSGYLQDTWEYDPVEDLWKQRTSFEGSNRAGSVAFTSQDGRGFVTTGSNGSSSTSFFDDIWEFKPTEAYNEDN